MGIRLGENNDNEDMDENDVQVNDYVEEGVCLKETNVTIYEQGGNTVNLNIQEQKARKNDSNSNTNSNNKVKVNLNGIFFIDKKMEKELNFSSAIKKKRDQESPNIQTNSNGIRGPQLPENFRVKLAD